MYAVQELGVYGAGVEKVMEMDMRLNQDVRNLKRLVQIQLATMLAKTGKNEPAYDITYLLNLSLSLGLKRRRGRGTESFTRPERESMGRCVVAIDLPTKPITSPAVSGVIYCLNADRLSGWQGGLSDGVSPLVERCERWVAEAMVKHCVQLAHLTESQEIGQGPTLDWT